MEFNLIKKLVLLVLIASSSPCIAEVASDQELIELAKQSFIRVKAAKNDPDSKKAILDTLGHLNDSERTRALALRMFDFDKSDGRLQYNVDSVVMYVFFYDAQFIKDPAPLKEMMLKEKDARKFYLLSAIAARLMNSQKSDFVVEMAPMLFRHEPLAKMSVDSEYYFSNLTDASKYFYGLLLRNLELLNSTFVPPDEKLPYPEKIAILAKWLKENYRGCEELSEKPIQSSISAEKNFTELKADQKQKEIPDVVTDKSVPKSPTRNFLWQILGAGILLVLAFSVWIKKRSSGRY